MRNTIPMPSRIRALPRNKAGYPIPFFAAEIDGERDFRVADAAAFDLATSQADRFCWICGQRRPRGAASFVIGPMCAVNRVTAEPPSHIECAGYAARACPFLTRPAMIRRENGLPENRAMPGIPIMRNPGACAVWTSTWRSFRTPDGGVMFDLGKPAAVTWYAQGRRATRDEISESIRSGIPLLEAACDTDSARRALHKQHNQAMLLLPKAGAA